MSLVQRMWLSFILMLIPTVISIVFISASSKKQIDFTKKERIGVELIRDLSKWMIYLAQRETLVIGHSRASSLQFIDDQIFATILNLESKNSLFEKIAYSETLVRRKKFQLSIKNLKNEFQHVRGTLAIPEQLNLDAYAKLMEHLKLAIALVGDQSDLILDAELDSFYSEDISVKVFPAVLATAFSNPLPLKVKAYDDFSESALNLTSSAALLTGRDIPSLSVDIDNIIGVSQGIKGPARAPNDNLVTDFELLKTQISEVAQSNLQQVAAKKINFKDYVGTRTKLSDQLKECWTSVNTFLTNLLDDRLTRLKNQYDAELACLSTLVLLSSGLFFFNGRTILRLVRLSHQKTGEAQKLAHDFEEQMKVQEDLRNQIMAQDKLASLGILSAGIAHEIKNPLNITINSAKILKEMMEEELGPSFDRLRELANFNHLQFQKEIGNCMLLCSNIEASSEKANLILNKMLDLARSERSALEEVDMSDFIQECAALAYSRMQARNMVPVHIENLVMPHLKIFIFPQELSRVLVNIFDNAFYAMWEKRMTDDAFEGRLVISMLEQERRIELKISDNGVGIAPEKLPRVFDPFFTTKPPGSGTGLGLSISYDLIKLHRGSIGIANNPGGGAVFTIGISKHLNEGALHGKADSRSYS